MPSIYATQRLKQLIDRTELFAEDLPKLRMALAYRGAEMSDKELGWLYSQWSEEAYSAGWMVTGNDGHLKEFVRWLDELNPMEYE